MAYSYSSESEGTQDLRRQRGRATTANRERLFGVPRPPPPPAPRPANMAQQHPGGPPAAINWAGMNIGYDDFDVDQFMHNVGIGGPPLSPTAGPQTPPPPTIPTSVGVGSAPVQTPTATTGVGVGTRRPTPTQEPITRSVQLPYSLYETAFSQVGLFLDKPFPRIGFQ